MQKKEINVWVSPSLVDNAKTGSEFVYSPIYGKDEHVPTNFTKAKLIIEIPDKSVSITESELSSMLLEMASDDMYKLHRKQVLAKLFGEQS